jgi:hypothetical protein
MNKLLKEKLSFVSARQQQLRFWCLLASSWAWVALVGLGVAIVQRLTGWSSWVALPAVVLLALLAWAFTLSKTSKDGTNWRLVALELEKEYPELDGRLLTAVQQEPADGQNLSYLQERLTSEALRHNDARDWAGNVSHRRLATARIVHWLALMLLGVVLVQLRVGPTHSFLAPNHEIAINVTPGDVSLERGSALVVLARFSGALPANVELVISKASQTLRVPLVKSLADPMFGGTVAEVTSNISYHVEYAGRRTREYNVSVFEYPRLQRADVDVTYPSYTGEPVRHIDNTRRVSAVEGSSLELSFQLNKPVVLAQFVSRKQSGPTIPLIVESNQPFASLHEFFIESSKTYDLELRDGEGRTNKIPAQFVFEALKNRTPEIKLVSPRGDLRPSPLEEISFEGSVWDDFGVTDYGIGYSVPGQSDQFIPLGKSVPARQKQQFKYLLRLEDIQVKPDDLVSWFVWADDIGSDGNVRRTVGDLFFGEIRPFDEVFKEGQGMDGQGQGQGQGQSGGGSQTTRLTELQKQIISATWNLQRKKESSQSQGATPKRKIPSLPGRDSSNSASPLQNEGFAGDLDQDHDSLLVQGMSGLAKAKLLSSVRTFGRLATPEDGSTPADDSAPAAKSRLSRRSSEGTEDITVVRDSQAEALEQAKAAAERARDARTEALWAAATKQMEQALAQLRDATNSAASFKQALAAEQAAYQTLLKLQEHEYQVSRQRNRGRSGNSRQQQMERQLEQMDLTQSEDRYENQRQAQAPQNSQTREQLQVMNRLQELARRQNDLNARLKELQTALQEAKTEQEREELRRRLKRLQEEEQQMLADVDELRQRMDRPENQSRMADERRQLDQTREDVQRAAEAASQGAASQALAAGTRAERQLQEMRDQLRKENSSQFADDLRNMRSQARELAQRQQEIQKDIRQDDSGGHKSLSEETDSKRLIDQLDRQKQLMTNLVDKATQISQQAESSEPLLSSQLYDTVRKFSQDSGKNLQQLQEELLGRGLMPGNLMETLKNDSEPDGAKLLDVTSEMLRRDFTAQANQASERAAGPIENLKRGVERAAESVLGNDTEALRLAQQELDQLTSQLQNEMTQAEQQAGRTNGAGELAARSENEQNATAGSSRGGNRDRDQSAQDRRSQADRSGNPATQNSSNPGEQSSTVAQTKDGQTSESGGNPSSANSGVDSQSGANQRSEQARSGRNRGASSADSRGNPQSGSDIFSGSAAQWGGGGDWNFDRYLDGGAWRRSGPITGEDFLPWSDRLREIEEIIEQPDLRNEVAAARERARLLRQDFRRDLKKPDWAVIKTQVMTPLVEVRDRIAEELARRQSSDALVPIDRDPVPSRYSEIVRRYYEELGKDK